MTLASIKLAQTYQGQNLPVTVFPLNLKSRMYLGDHLNTKISFKIEIQGYMEKLK